MNKDKLKGFAAGVAASLLVSAAVVPAVAAGVTKTAELYYNNIKVVIEGKQADLKDALGNPVEPFAINGTTYLPVRAVANALDQAVSWDGKTQTVYIGASEVMEQPSVWLKDMEVFAGGIYTNSKDAVEFGGYQYNNWLTDNAGNVYENYIQLKDGVSYILNGKYSNFKGTHYLINNYKNTSTKERIVVYGDGELLYATNGVGREVLPEDFNIDVSNVMVLKIFAQRQSSNGTWYQADYSDVTAIGNAGLFVPQEGEPAEEAAETPAE